MRGDGEHERQRQAARVQDLGSLQGDEAAK